ncbi:chitin synthase-domain-containing protein [Boletus edulis]|nr:chitin synthase-domain-containing protein [Boletus edulis]
MSFQMHTPFFKNMLSGYDRDLPPERLTTVSDDSDPAPALRSYHASALVGGVRGTDGEDGRDGWLCEGECRVDQKRLGSAGNRYSFRSIQAAFHSLEDCLHSLDVEEQRRNRLRDAEAEAGLDVHSIGDLSLVNQVTSQAHVPLVANASPFQRGNLYEDDYEDRKPLRSDDFDNRGRLTSNREETNSNYGSKSYAPSRNMFQNIGSSTLGLAMLAPNLDVRQAWREKFALNVIIWFICACAVFVIAVLGVVICPTEHVFSTSELASHSFLNSANNVYTAIRGEVPDLMQVALTHQRVVSVIPTKSILQYGGQDATNLFPASVQVSALCNGVSGSVSPWVQLSAANTTDLNAQYHDFRAVSNDSHPDWYFKSMTVMRWNNRVGYMGYTPQEISSRANTKGCALGIYDGLIYDLTDTLVNLFKYSSGQDLTKAIDNLNIDSGTLAAQKTCLRNLFLIGMVDSRNSPQCLFSQYILLALSVMMVSIIAFKFIASINFGSPRAPEDHDKFVICQVPCYTEGEVSLHRTIDSLAQLKYDDKHKLILVVCDGNIVGCSNDRPTSRIVLDILGVDSNLDPEPLSFVSLGEGARQHNMGKVYSGLYECGGHVVDLTQVASTHQRVVSIIPIKSILQYGGQDATNLFPASVQVSALCNGVSGSVSPWVLELSAANTTDLNAQYHDFRAVSNDYRTEILIICDGNIVCSSNDSDRNRLDEFDTFIGLFGLRVVSRHPKYYFDDPGCHVFLVENTLYRLSMGNLGRHSQILADMFKTGGQDPHQGRNDDHPIEIPQLPMSTFDLFVEHHFGYPRAGANRYTKEELQDFLEFCEKYECDVTKNFVVNRIEAASWRFHSAELMGLAMKYRLPSLFRIAFRTLTKMPLAKLTKGQRTLIGPDIALNVALAKCILDEQCRIIAAEEPPILSHADDCQEPLACEADWHGVWWNGMGRCLLDGRNPQPYDEAVRRFKSEMQFGRVGKGCKEKMFQLLDDGAAFKRGDLFVEEVCDYLVSELRF